jgi:hypothetical protein
MSVVAGLVPAATQNLKDTGTGRALTAASRGAQTALERTFFDVVRDCACHPVIRLSICPMMVIFETHFRAA